jgi:hypothetical protein
MLLPFNLANGHRADVHDIIRAGMWAPIIALARVEACSGWVKSDHRAQKRVGDVGDACSDQHDSAQPPVSVQRYQH